MKKCEMCAEEILDEAKKCKHCGHMIVSTVKTDKIQISSGIGRGLLSFIIPGLGQLVNGEIVKGLIFLVVALIIASVTGGFGAIIVAIVAFIDCKPNYKCGNCGTKTIKDLDHCNCCYYTFNTYDNKNYGDTKVNPIIVIVVASIFIFAIGYILLN